MNGWQIALSGVMLFVTLLNLGVIVGIRSGSFMGRTSEAKDAMDRRITDARADLERRMGELERRMDKASEHSSRLAGVVQEIVGKLDRLPEALRDKFISHDSAELMIEDRIRNRRSRER